jgi:hypothetical protein
MKRCHVARAFGPIVRSASARRCREASTGVAAQDEPGGLEEYLMLCRADFRLDDLDG